jgi:hypothetical protein
VFLHMRQGGGRHIYSDEGGVASASRENDGRGIASCVCSAGAVMAVVSIVLPCSKKRWSHRRHWISNK